MPYRRHHTRTGRPYRDAPPREMASNRAGYCCGCGQPFAAGDRILWEPSTGRTYAMACGLKPFSTTSINRSRGTLRM